jgi:excisionase family DNA binding protein
MADERGKLLGATAVAKLVGVPHTTVTRWINQGKLKAYATLGGRNRVNMDDLVGLAKSHNLPLPDDLLDKDRTRVMIVDDDEAILKVLTEGFKKFEGKFTVATATDGFEAGQIMERLKPDIVVLDIFLPDLDGVSVCQIIKESQPKTKVIAITGRAGSEMKQAIQNAGADVFIQKPFAVDDLVARIRDLMRWG